MSSSSPNSSSSPLQTSSRRRDRSNPLQDAKDAIENKNNMNEADRFSLLSGALLSLPETDRLALVYLAVSSRWIDGMNVLLSGISVEALNKRDVLHFSLRFSSSPQKNEQHLLHVFESFLDRGCGVNSVLFATPSDVGHYTVMRDRFTGAAKYTASAEEFKPGTSYGVMLVQCVVKENLPSILKLILPKLLQSSHLRFGLIEAFARNVRACCDVFVENATSQQDMMIFLCCAYGRSDYLKRLLEKTPAVLRSALAKQKFDNIDQFTPLPIGAPNEQTVLDAAVYFDNPECLKIILNMLYKSTSYHYSSLLLHCVTNDFPECACLLIEHGSSVASDDKNVQSQVRECLLFALRSGSSAPLTLITALVKQMRKAGQYKQCLDGILYSCLENRWFNGLLTLASIVGRERGCFRTKDIQRTLLALTTSGSGHRSEQIIKHLALTSGIDSVPSFTNVAVVSENESLTKFFLSLDDKSIKNACARLLPGAKNSNIKKLMENVVVGVKVEAEESQDATK